MTPNPGFPVSVDLKDRVCLVLGGDEDAADKVSRLLDASAKVTVIHPILNDALRKLTAAAKVIHRARRFRTTDVEGVTLVINTLRDDLGLSRSLYELATKERFLVWSIDQPDTSTVMMPAVVSRGHLRLAISTSGVSPALASRLRQDLEAIFDQQFERFLERLAHLREEVQHNQPDSTRRREDIRGAVAGFRLTGQLSYPPAWDRSEQGATQDATGESSETGLRPGQPPATTKIIVI